MSQSLERSAEITKLARLLSLDTKQLQYLESVPAEAIRTFRERATDRLYDGDDRLKRIAAASKLVPVPLTVKIAQLALGPLLCAATAGLLEPAHAVKIASKCPTSFLADITIDLDPRRAAEVIAAVPTPLVVAVAKELLARNEHVTMGRFVSYLSHATLSASVPAIEDDADLLRVAFVMEGKDHLDDLFDLARPRFEGLIRTAYEQDLWGEALDLISHLSLESRGELADLTASLGGDVLDALIRAAGTLQAWDALLPITTAMSEESLRRFAEAPAVQEPEIIGQIVDAALASGLWVELLPLTRYLPEQTRVRVAEHIAQLDDETLQQIAEDAHEAQLWDALLPIALAFDDDTRRRLAGFDLMQRDDVLRAAIDTAARHDLWAAVLPLADALPEASKPRIAECIGELTREQMLAAVRAASESADVVTLVDLALRQEDAGRIRVLELVSEVDQLDEFAALLDKQTPNAVWTAFVEVADEMPARVREVIAKRARSLSKRKVAAQLQPPTAPG